MMLTSLSSEEIVMDSFSANIIRKIEKFAGTTLILFFTFLYVRYILNLYFFIYLSQPLELAGLIKH